MPIPPPSAPTPAPSAPNPMKSEPTPSASIAPSPPVAPPRAEVRLCAAAPTPVLAPLVAPLPVLLRLDSALIGAEALDDPSDAEVPTAACEIPVPDDGPGVDRLCRACDTDDMACPDVLWAVLPACPVSPAGLVVGGGGVNALKVEAEAELAA